MSENIIIHILLLLMADMVRSIARRAIDLQFDISANTLEIRAIRNAKCIA
jgi:hypothetical protein